MADKELREVVLEINTPVLVKPWRARAVTTKYGDKLMLVVREGDEEAEVRWLPIDLANDLKALNVLDIGTYEDSGKTKYTVRKGAPDVVIQKAQKAGDKHPHYEVALASPNDGPEMPPKKTPVGDGVQSTDAALAEAVRLTKMLCVGLDIENLDDPLVAQAAIECAEKLFVTFLIGRNR